MITKEKTPDCPVGVKLRKPVYETDGKHEAGDKYFVPVARGRELAASGYAEITEGVELIGGETPPAQPEANPVADGAKKEGKK